MQQNDVTIFVEANVEPENSTFISCIKLLIYSYLSLKTDKINDKFSRETIIEIIRDARHSENSHLELEDYLRNYLVKKYVLKNREEFDLGNIHFELEVAELKNNVSIGSLDIKASQSSLEDDIYFIFECKRLNQNARFRQNYYAEGIYRFIEEKYYPESPVNVGGLIAFIEYDQRNPGDRLEINNSDVILTNLIAANSVPPDLIENVRLVPLNDTNFPKLNNFNFIFKSLHKRNIRQDSIILYHLLFDFNDLITQ